MSTDCGSLDAAACNRIALLFHDGLALAMAYGTQRRAGWESRYSINGDSENGMGHGGTCEEDLGLHEAADKDAQL